VTKSAQKATTTAHPDRDPPQPSSRPALTGQWATDTTPQTASEKTFTGSPATTGVRCPAARSSGYPLTPSVHKIAIRIQTFR